MYAGNKTVCSFPSQVCCGALWIGMSPSPHGRSPETIRSTTVNYFSSNIKARSKDWYGCNTNKQVLIFKFRKKHTVEPPVYFWYSTDYEIYIYIRGIFVKYIIFSTFSTFSTRIYPRDPWHSATLFMKAFCIKDGAHWTRAGESHFENVIGWRWKVWNFAP